MKFYQFPRPIIKALLFDMDNTLYTNESYTRHQIDVQIEGAAQHLGKDYHRFLEELTHFQQQWSSRRGGKIISLANSLIELGIPFAEILRFREQLIQPEKFLAPDPMLIQTFNVLAPFFRLAVVTNNPLTIAHRTLITLGIRQHVTSIVGIDRAGVSKPHERPFTLSLTDLGVAPSEAVSIGDRYDIDIAIPLQMGMGGILIEGVQEIYQLPKVLGVAPTKRGFLFSNHTH